MRYRRRLRSRIIISFALFGLGLTALFALATLYMRARLEDQLIDRMLRREVANFVEFKREHPEPDALWKLPIFDAVIYSARRFGNVPFDVQKYDSGVYNINDIDADGQRRPYKLAVYKSPEYWAFLRFDYGFQMLGARQLGYALGITVIAFAILSLLIGLWLSARVMSPVTDLAARLRQFRKTGEREELAPHFANDEVGQLAGALDDYSSRLTELVERDREFNADVSHELRTPLAVIATTTELLLASDVPEKVHNRLKRIERAVRQSTELTDALLLLSRRERRAASSGETTDVGRIVEQVVDVNRPHLLTKPVTVHVDVADSFVVSAPSSVVAVALGNLVGNAFKYTQQGDITIKVGDGRVVVEDTGPGIKAEEADQLFQRGVRGSAGGKGAGLGLAIVTRLCELYGWKASLSPRPEGGAIATLEFHR